ncbi:MAG: hypothetical protein ACXAEU_16595 [Candidatus Hodarchaeales archaeon]
MSPGLWTLSTEFARITDFRGSSSTLPRGLPKAPLAHDPFGFGVTFTFGVYLPSIGSHYPEDNGGDKLVSHFQLSIPIQFFTSSSVITPPLFSGLPLLIDT